MAFRPARMQRVDIVVLAKDERPVTSALGRLGILHLVEIGAEEAGGALKRPDIGGGLEKCRALLLELDFVREKLGLTALPPAAAPAHEPISALADRVAAIGKRADALGEEREKVEAESEEVQDELARLEALDHLTVPLSRLAGSSFLHFAVGVIKPRDLLRLREAAAGEDFLLLGRPDGPDTSRLIGISSRKGRFALDTLLRRYNFEGQDLSALPKGTPAEVIATLTRRADGLREKHGKLAQQRQALADAAAPDIAALERSLRLELALLEAQLNFVRSSSAYVIRGWLPASVLPGVSQELLDVTGGRMILQVREPGETGTPPAEVPVLMKNNRFLKPFEALVRGVGVPQYDEIEPTPFVALSFLIMYGIMFGDVGQGIVLAAVGFMMRRKSRDSGLRDIGAVVCYAGLAGVLGGFFYDTAFGRPMRLYEPLLSPENPEDAAMVLGLPILFGILLISLGVILNIINKLRMRDVLPGIVDRFGVMGIVFYWGALALAAHGALSGSIAVGPAVIVLLALPLAVIFLRGPIFRRLRRSKERAEEEEGIVATAIHGGIEVLDTLTAFLANTVSFARVGAFALAHAGLCMAVYVIAEQAYKLPLGVLWSVLVIVLGNILVIALEGLVVFVQCLRLEYYEFFGKFFGGSGKKYKPFRIEQEA